VINTDKVQISVPCPLNLEFHYEIRDFQPGLKRLALLLKQQEKMALTKQNVLSIINTKSEFVRRSIAETYSEISFHLYNVDGSNRVRTLYNEWDRVFGVLYGEDEEATDYGFLQRFVKHTA
jgi:hypothetical protein